MTDAGISFGFELMEVLFAWHSDEAEHVQPLNEWLKDGTDVKALDLACGYSQKPFDG